MYDKVDLSYTPFLLTVFLCERVWGTKRIPSKAKQVKKFMKSFMAAPFLRISLYRFKFTTLALFEKVCALATPTYQPINMAERISLSRFDTVTMNGTWETIEKDEADSKLTELSNAFHKAIKLIGEDPEREGLRATPLRAAKALCYFTKGYEETIEGIYCSVDNKL